jgi:anti-sigma regulatory factor (Ser/Thr protein kinase)
MIDVELPSTAAAPARARGALGELSGRVSARRLEDLRLLVSELVTNAVRHAQGEIVRLVVRLQDGHLRVEVHDLGRGFEVQAPSDDPKRASGWGLVLVDELADRWGVDANPATAVWFEIDA